MRTLKTQTHTRIPVHEATCLLPGLQYASGAEPRGAVTLCNAQRATMMREEVGAVCPSCTFYEHDMQRSRIQQTHARHEQKHGSVMLTQQHKIPEN